MADQDLDNELEVNPLDMSDEDIMNMEFPEEGVEPDLEEPVEPADTEVDETDADVADPEDTEEAEEEPEAETETEESEDETEEEEETGSDEYKAQIEKLLAPFKANGKDIKVDSVDDAITLMKMGANYNKKMAALKPNLKIMRMLENQGLLEEGKLNYLIDLSKNKPEAISRLVKESGIDPLDINTDDSEGYEPESYTVDERQMAIDDVLESIKDTETYSATIDTVSNKWDQASRKIIIDNPEVIRVINDHKQNGLFDQITTEVDRDRMLGKLDGLSDIQAYRQVGDRLYAEGKFGSAEPAPSANETVNQRSVPKPNNPQLKNRKKAASTTKASPATKAPTDFNPLAMSDDDFEKLSASKYM